jgi:hypothetical protein
MSAIPQTNMKIPKGSASMRELKVPVEEEVVVQRPDILEIVVGLI